LLKAFSYIASSDEILALGNAQDMSGLFKLQPTNTCTVNYYNNHFEM